MIGPIWFTPALLARPGVGAGKYRTVGVPVPVTVATISGRRSKSELVFRLFKPWIASMLVPTWRKSFKEVIMKSARTAALESARLAGAPEFQVATEGSGELSHATSRPLI